MVCRGCGGSPGSLTGLGNSIQKRSGKNRVRSQQDTAAEGSKHVCPQQGSWQRWENSKGHLDRKPRGPNLYAFFLSNKLGATLTDGTGGVCPTT